MTKEELDKNENKYFENWLEKIYKDNEVDNLNHFEHNLEVWR